MQQANPSQGRAGNRPSSAQVTSLALRGIGQIYDMNLAATRVLLQTQARAASAFGWPDWSEVFDHVDDRTRNVFAASTEQLVQTAQRASEVAADLQRQVGRVVETQAVTMAETIQHGLEELGTQTHEGLQQLCDTARQQAEQAEQVAQTLSQEMHETMRQGGEHLRDAMRQGGEQLNETMRQGGQQLSGAAREGGEQAREASQRGAQDAGSASQGATAAQPAHPGGAPAEDKSARRGKP